MRPRRSRSTAVVRLVVLAALVATVWLAGPRALAVMRARTASLAHAAERASARVDLDRVGFAAAPGWLRGPLLQRVMRDLSPCLRGEVGLADADAGAELRRRLLAVPWVAAVRLTREFPDAMRARVELRRPVLAVVAEPAGPPRLLVDGGGFCLPAVEGVSLPWTVSLAPAAVTESGRHGDPAVVAAAATACEWQRDVVPAFDPPPRLLAVDASNLGHAALAPDRTGEVRLLVAAGAGGAGAALTWGHPPGSGPLRVPTATKVEVLGALLAEFPGFAGIVGADLRMRRRWRDWVVRADGVVPALAVAAAPAAGGGVRRPF